MLTRSLPGLGSALEVDAGFQRDIAIQAATLACNRAGHICIAKAAEAVAVGWGTTRLTAAVEWWAGPGRQLMQMIQNPPDRHFDWVDEAYCAIGELLAEPAPDAYDPNWPDHKLFWAVDIPAGHGVGDTFVVGNGMGDRYRMKVIERGSTTGVAVDDHLGHPLRAREDDAYAQATSQWPYLAAECSSRHRA